jgi:hypothetical protein
MSPRAELEVSYPEVRSVRTDYGMWSSDCQNFPEIIAQQAAEIAEGAGPVATRLAGALGRFQLSWGAAFAVLESSAGLIAQNADNFQLDLSRADDGLAELFQI